MAEPEGKEITTENVLSVKIPKIALSERFGSLKFENASEKLSEIQEWLVEATDLGFEELLLLNHVSQIKTYTQQLADKLKWLQKFDIGTTTGNAKTDHDNFESQIDGFYNGIYENLRMKYLPFLRDERRRENPEEKSLDEEVRKAAQLRKELEDELTKVRSDIEQIKSTKQEVGSAKGERAAVRLAIHFDKEAGIYGNIAKRWFWAVAGGYTIVLGTLVTFGIMTIIYINKSVTEVSSTSTTSPVSLGEIGLTPGMLWTIGIAKLVIIAALWYGLSFIIKNYNVNSQLVAVNRHRATVARTLEDFVAAEQEQDKPRLSEMLQNAADAMFKHSSIGFVSKADKETASNPVLQIINDLMGVKNS